MKRRFCLTFLCLIYFYINYYRKGLLTGFKTWFLIGFKMHTFSFINKYTIYILRSCPKYKITTKFREITYWKFFWIFLNLEINSRFFKNRRRFFSPKNVFFVKQLLIPYFIQILEEIKKNCMKVLMKYLRSTNV